MFCLNFFNTGADCSQSELFNLMIPPFSFFFFFFSCVGKNLLKCIFFYLFFFCCWQNLQGLCTFAAAWADVAFGVNDAHHIAECSNMGVCDRRRGVCVCDGTTEGPACERCEGLILHNVKYIYNFIQF